MAKSKFKKWGEEWRETHFPEARSVNSVLQLYPLGQIINFFDPKATFFAFARAPDWMWFERCVLKKCTILK